MDEPQEKELFKKIMTCIFTTIKKEKKCGINPIHLKIFRNKIYSKKVVIIFYSE